jgi:hypothetical protein
MMQLSIINKEMGAGQFTSYQSLRKYLIEVSPIDSRECLSQLAYCVGLVCCDRLYIYPRGILCRAFLVM